MEGTRDNGADQSPAIHTKICCCFQLKEKIKAVFILPFYLNITTVYNICGGRPCSVLLHPAQKESVWATTDGTAVGMRSDANLTL